MFSTLCLIFLKTVNNFIKNWSGQFMAKSEPGASIENSGDMATLSPQSVGNEKWGSHPCSGWASVVGHKSQPLPGVALLFHACFNIYLALQPFEWFSLKINCVDALGTVGWKITPQRCPYPNPPKPYTAKELCRQNGWDESDEALVSSLGH